MALRSVLLFLSRRKRLRRFIETSLHAKRFTSRFIAGLTLEDALAVCRHLQCECILTMLDRLGESVTSLGEAAACRDGYIEALRRLSELCPESRVSIKLTQLGLDVSERACRENVSLLVREAASLGMWVEVDMESSEYLDCALDIVAAMWESCHNVRVAIQAYLHRSEEAIERLCGQRVPVRLCKGAYREPPAVAFQRKREVDANYIRLMKHLLERGNCPALATHDETIIEEVKRFAVERQIMPDRFEFQMLYGIRRDLERRFVEQGYRLRLYIPYGEAWYPYFMRRLAERPANVLFLLRNMVRG